MQFQILPFKIKFTASWNGSHRPPRLWFLSEFLKCLSTPRLGTAWNNYTWWEVLMPLTLPATHLHTREKFMCQLPGVLLPSWTLPTPPRSESACSFITAIPQVRFISKRRTRCGLQMVLRFASGVKVQLGGHTVLLWAFWGCRVEEKLVETNVNPGKVWKSCLQVCWEVDLGMYLRTDR